MHTLVLVYTLDVMTSSTLQAGFYRTKIFIYPFQSVVNYYKDWLFTTNACTINCWHAVTQLLTMN